MTTAHFLLFSFFSLCFSYANASASACKDTCIEPFGQVLGESSRSTAYSNCRETCGSPQQNYIEREDKDTHQKTKLYTGSQWQCVEYARRWLIINKGVKFGIVQFAHQIWDLDSFEDVKTHAKREVLKFRNRQSKTPPEPGDLLIYSKKLLGTGHVAVITQTKLNRVSIAEQNYFNARWSNPEFSRQLLMTRDQQDHYTLHDEEILGWMRVVP